MKSNYSNICENLKNFGNEENYLKVIERDAPPESDSFFENIYSSLTSVYGFINFKTAKDDVTKLINKKIPLKEKKTSFYEVWINDMVSISKMFCSFLKEDKISFWIGSKRGCTRYHIDMVAFRLLVTYAGSGTEILPNYAANKKAFIRGMPNNQIVKNKSAIKYLKKWDIALFKGGENGILHRTPDSALNHGSSILMRLDKSSFLEDIQKINIV